MINTGNIAVKAALYQYADTDRELDLLACANFKVYLCIKYKVFKIRISVTSCRKGEVKADARCYRPFKTALCRIFARRWGRSALALAVINLFEVILQFCIIFFGACCLFPLIERVRPAETVIGFLPGVCLRVFFVDAGRCVRIAFFFKSVNFAEIHVAERIADNIRYKSGG